MMDKRNLKFLTNEKLHEATVDFVMYILRPPRLRCSGTRFVKKKLLCRSIAFASHDLLSKQVHRKSIEDPMGFWSKAAESISWIRAPLKVMAKRELEAADAGLVTTAITEFD